MNFASVSELKLAFYCLCQLGAIRVRDEAHTIDTVIQYHNGKRSDLRRGQDNPSASHAVTIERYPSTSTYSLVSISSIFVPQLEVLMGDVPQATSLVLFGRTSLTSI